MLKQTICHVGKPMKMSQKHRNLEIIVVMYPYSEEVTQRKKLRRKEGKKGGWRDFKGCGKQQHNSGVGFELILGRPLY